MGMTLRRWRCATADCEDPGMISVSFIVSTQGTRRNRVQRTTTSVRLCKACCKALAHGKLPEPLKLTFRSGYRVLTNEDL